MQRLLTLKEICKLIEDKEHTSGYCSSCAFGFLDANGVKHGPNSCREEFSRKVYQLLFKEGKQDITRKRFPLLVWLQGSRSGSKHDDKKAANKATRGCLQDAAKRSHLLFRCAAAVEDACKTKRHRPELIAKSVRVPPQNFGYHRVDLVWKLDIDMDWLVAPPLIFYYGGFVKTALQGVGAVNGKKLRDIREKRNSLIEKLLKHPFGSLLVKQGGPTGLFGTCRLKNWQGHQMGFGHEWFTRALEENKEVLETRFPELSL